MSNSPKSLNRFIEAQDESYDEIVRELENGSQIIDDTVCVYHS